MSTHEHEPGGIHARHIEADNVVSGVQMQGGDAQIASSLIQLAQSIRQGKISAEEIKARNLVSGLQYIADPAQASVEDLRRELLALRTQLEEAIAAHEQRLLTLATACIPDLDRAVIRRRCEPGRVVGEGY